MSETAPEIPPTQMFIGAEYKVNKPTSDVAVLHLLPHESESPPYWKKVDTLLLETGEPVIYEGTARERDITGDVENEMLIFRPGKVIRERRSGIVDKDVLAVNSLTAGNFDVSDPFADLNGNNTPRFMEMVKGHPDKSIHVRVRFPAGQEQTFVFPGNRPEQIDKLFEIITKGQGKIISQAISTLVPE